MSDPTTDAPGSTESDEIESGDTQDTPEDHGGANANAEAAKWRTKLRETETALAETTAQLEAARRVLVERYVEGKLDVPRDLFEYGGVAVADLLTDDGQIDTSKIDAAIETLLEQRPRLAAPTAQRPNWGQSATHKRPDHSTTWAQALRPH